MIVRHTKISISIKGKEVTRDLEPYLINISFTDKSDDQLDDLQLVFEDRERKFQGDWMPEPGDKIEAKFTTHNWRHLGDSGVVECGDFEVDEIELESSFEGGDVITIKAVPAVVKSSLMEQKKTRAWAEASLAEVISDIAGEAGLDTLYKAPEIVYERVEQRAESDLTFMQRICKDQGLRLALKKGKVVVYMGQTADSSEPIEFRRDTADVQSFRLKKTMAGIYTECRVGYNDPQESEEIESQFKPEEPPATGKVLTINKRVEHPAQAERLARAELRDKNSQEITGSFSGMGDPRYIAGCILEFKGWGKYDGKYVIKESKHEYRFDGGYTCDVSIEKALEY